MSHDVALFMSRQMLWNALLIASPVIVAGLLCGLIVSILQVVTQIQDASLSAAPKLLVVVLMLMLCGEWMLHSLTDFARECLLHSSQVLR